MSGVWNMSAWTPGVEQFGSYQRRWLRADLVAGVSVAAYLVPQVMAYAALAGLAPVAGLWTAMVPLAVYAVLGSSRQLSVGPESTTALMTAAVVAPRAAGDPARYATLAAMLALLVGVICLVAGMVGLGLLANLLSRPVLVGYMAGVAVLMMASQVGTLTGIDVSGDGFSGRVRTVAGGIDQVKWPTVVLSLAVLVVLIVLAWLVPRAPGPLIAVGIATAVVGLLSLDRYGIDVVGVVPAGWPAVTLPRAGFSEVGSLIIPAIGIAIVAFSDNVLTARIFASRKGEEIDANAELRAVGMCNMAVGVVQGFPVSSSGSRTAVGELVGSRTQLYSVSALTCVLAVMVFGRGVLAMFPTAALGALVVYAALRLINVGEFRRLSRFRRSELVLAAATIVAVLCLGVLYGVLAAVGLSILDLLRRVAHAHDSVLGFVPGLPGMHDIDDYPQAKPVPGLVIYRYDAPLCFANAEDFRRRALGAVEHNDPPAQWFVLNAEANVEVDLTALDALESLRAELVRRGVVFAMARVKQDLRDALRAAGILDRIGEQRIFMTLPTAVEAFARR
ncbi:MULTISPECIES: sulfate permease [Mycolicibacterium]|uniref:sulfate permease n=1 Tax=Mycolicibacterium TaxID=1866885 RepID=UPI00148FC8CA|nr:sulfate permease [Mycolicibacterium fortuitum]